MAFDLDDPAEFFDDDWTDSYSYNGMEYKGIPHGKTFSMSVINAGLSDGIAQSVMFKVADFETLPKIDETLDYKDVTYRIAGVRQDSTMKTFTVDLVEKYG